MELVFGPVGDCRILPTIFTSHLRGNDIFRQSQQRPCIHGTILHSQLRSVVDDRRLVDLPQMCLFHRPFLLLSPHLQNLGSSSCRMSGFGRKPTQASDWQMVKPQPMQFALTRPSRAAAAWTTAVADSPSLRPSSDKPIKGITVSDFPMEHLHQGPEALSSPCRASMQEPKAQNPLSLICSPTPSRTT